MNNMIWLMRAAQWVRHPPSAGRVALVAAIVVVVVLIGTADWMGWVPEWAQMERAPRRIPMP